ncbi:MAG: NAD(P)-dependent oxidoreductase [Candidatus Krumholzibacteriia bacterium]|nr:NAD(P)-dependent oxidoreductase [bacterium]MCB9514456.1 NAD(P)-dependent oxidoreductase [Candidatus Latescibacterota bacterium]MCB9517260.1 NAD(P)-dependent oxidoreductase [Candidatus Latescibacterota bacterium]
MASQRPRILVTGASGLIGRHFLAATLDDCEIVGLARRTPQQVGIAEHPNLRWFQADIGRAECLEGVTEQIAAGGPIDFVLHLAGYYDFTYEDNPEYQRSNVDGTRNVLELARRLGVRRFIFASSLAACEFRGRREPIDEETPPDASFEYARSKRQGEAMLADYSRHFRATVLRFAAVVTDWCEYAPLYVFLNTWLSGAWNARILGGKGRTGITYIHIRDLIKLIRAVMAQDEQLPAFSTYVASPDGTVTHRELYDLAQRFYHGHVPRPILMPKPLAAPGVLLRDLVGRLVGRRPFERLWMLGYMDHQLRVDASRTRAALGWAPAERDHVLHRMLYMIENMISRPEIWRGRNEAFFRRRDLRPSLVISEELEREKERVLRELEGRLRGAGQAASYPRLRALPPEEVRRMLRVLLQLLVGSIRGVNRSLLLNYIDERWPELAGAGVAPEEFCELLGDLNAILLGLTIELPRLAGLRQQCHSFISLTLQLARDQVYVADEHLRLEPAGVAAPTTPPTAPRQAVLGSASEVIDQLRARYRLSPHSTLTLDDLQLLLQALEDRQRR